NQVAKLAHQRGTFGRRARGPLRERGLRGGNGRVNLRRRSRSDLGQDLLRRRIDSLEVVPALDRLAADEVLNSHCFLLAAHSQRVIGPNHRPNSASPTMVFTSRPMPSISVTTSSPTFTLITPSGVPVRI